MGSIDCYTRCTCSMWKGNTQIHSHTQYWQKWFMNSLLCICNTLEHKEQFLLIKIIILRLYLTFRNLRLWTHTQLVHVLTFLILVLSWQFEWGILGCFYQLESYHISYQAVHWLFGLLVHNHLQFWLDGYPSPAAVQLAPEELQQALKKWKNIKLQQCWHYFPMSFVIFCSVQKKMYF